MKYHPFWGTIHGTPIYLGPGSTVTLRHPPSAGYLNSECRNHHFSLISPLFSDFSILDAGWIFRTIEWLNLIPESSNYPFRIQLIQHFGFVPKSYLSRHSMTGMNILCAALLLLIHMTAYVCLSAHICCKNIHTVW